MRSVEFVPISGVDKEFAVDLFVGWAKTHKADMRRQGFYAMPKRHADATESAATYDRAVAAHKDGSAKSYLVRYNDWSQFIGSATLINGLQLLQPKTRTHEVLPNIVLKAVRGHTPVDFAPVAPTNSTVNAAFYVPTEIIDGEPPIVTRNIVQTLTESAAALYPDAEVAWALTQAGTAKDTAYQSLGYVNKGNECYDEREGIVGWLPNTNLRYIAL